jgi:hypothetical protein
LTATSARGAASFRLIPLPGGRTRLEGRTWYTLDIHPEPYWGIYANAIVHAIHERVLEHVKRLAEGEGDAVATAPLDPAPTAPLVSSPER